MTRSKTLHEMPMDQIKEVVAHHPRVKCIIKRRNAKGTLSSLPTVEKDSTDIPNLEEFIREEWGGGRYRVVLRNPENDMEDLTTPFEIEIEGPMKAVGRPNNGAPQPRSIPFRGGFAGGGIPSHAAVAASREPHLDPADFMSMTPDAIAMQQVQELRDQIKTEKAEWQRERREGEQRLERERERARQLEREAVEARAAHEKQMLELRMEMMTQLSQRPEPRPGPDYVGLAGAVVPAVIAMITSSQDRAALQQQASQKSLELQMEGTKTMVASLMSSKKGGDDSTVKLLEVVVPLALPIVQQMMEDKSPSKMVEILGSMGENQMATLSLVSQFVQQMAGESDNPWMEVAKQALSGVQNFAEQMVDLNQQQQQPVQAQVVDGARPPQKPLGPDSTPQEIGEALFASPMLPAELRSREWRNIFIALHDPRTPSRAAAVELCQHLERLADAGSFPNVFGQMMESEAPASSFVRPFLMQLPLSQLNPPRMEAILKEVDNILVEEEPPQEQPSGRSGFTPPGQVFDTEAEPVGV